MGRLIDTDEIKKREKDVVLANGAKHRCFDTTMLYEIPTVDAEPVKHGEWKPEITQLGTMIFRCSACQRFSDVHWAYCPQCGAKMDEVEEDAD